MTILLIIFILVLSFLVIRYNPSLDKLPMGEHELLILWYNKNKSGTDRDYIILW